MPEIAITPQSRINTAYTRSAAPRFGLNLNIPKPDEYIIKDEFIATKPQLEKAFNEVVSEFQSTQEGQYTAEKINWDSLDNRGELILKKNGKYMLGLWFDPIKTGFFGRGKTFGYEATLDSDYLDDEYLESPSFPQSLKDKLLALQNEFAQLWNKTRSY